MGSRSEQKWRRSRQFLRVIMNLQIHLLPGEDPLLKTPHECDRHRRHRPLLHQSASGPSGRYPDHRKSRQTDSTRPDPKDHEDLQISPTFRWSAVSGVHPPSSIQGAGSINAPGK